MQKISSLEQAANQQIYLPSANAPRTYCWSHSFKVRSDVTHTNMTCTRRRPGHQEQATAKNRMGGGYETEISKRNELHEL